MKKLITLYAMLSFFTLRAQQTVGLFTQTPSSLAGYVLFAPIHSDTTYLIDKCGREVHQWRSVHTPGLSVYLLPDGSLLRTGNIPNPAFSGTGGAGGVIEKFDWNSNLLWSYIISSSTETQNHDVCPLPNGNIIVDVWENVSAATAIAAGRDSSLLGTSLWSAKLIELQPIGTDSANIVWQWSFRDHLIQDFDSTKANYGVVANHPELMNINFNGINAAKAQDWLHINAVTYNASLDQVMLSAHNLSEIYIIDHSTTTAQASSHTGGAHGKGGDFLYRWGNPQSYNRGTAINRTLYLQHNPNWITQGYADGNRIMVFNNGVGRPGGNASSVDIIAQPVDASGNYSIFSGQAYLPTTAAWSYEDTVPTDFFSMNMGSAQRLSNGNTIICEATKGHFFEIDSSENTVWDYVNPVGSSGPISQTTTSTSNQVFRCIFYPSSYSGFIGQTLVSGNPIELNPYSYICSMNTTVEINEGKTQIFSINIYPNPTSSSVTIYSEGEKIKEVDVVNVLGKVIYQAIIDNPKTTIDLSNVAKGIYFVKIMGSSNNIANRKIILQ